MRRHSFIFGLDEILLFPKATEAVDGAGYLSAVDIDVHRLRRNGAESDVFDAFRPAGNKRSRVCRKCRVPGADSDFKGKSFQCLRFRVEDLHGRIERCKAKDVPERRGEMAGCQPDLFLLKNGGIDKQEDRPFRIHVVEKAEIPKDIFISSFVFGK